MSGMIPITIAGFEKIKEELKRLKTVDRQAVIKEIAEARALGDLSENAEYHAAREKQGFIEGKIQELENKTGRLQIVNLPNKGKIDKVIFGASVVLLDVSEDTKNEKKRYRIVSELEADLKNNAISITSPLASSLINKRTGDIVSVNLPRGTKEYEIEVIEIE